MGRYRQYSSPFAHSHHASLPASPHPPQHQQHHHLRLPIHLLIPFCTVYRPRGHHDSSHLRLCNVSAPRTSSPGTWKHRRRRASTWEHRPRPGVSQHSKPNRRNRGSGMECPATCPVRLTIPFQHRGTTRRVRGPEYGARISGTPSPPRCPRCSGACDEGCLRTETTQEARHVCGPRSQIVQRDWHLGP